MNPQNFDPQLPDPIGPTLEIPTPDIPAADFVSIGAAKRKGEKDSGFWEWLLHLIIDWIPDAIGCIVGNLLGLVEFIAAYFIRIFFKVFHSAEFGSDEVAAAAVGGLFGVEVASSAFHDASNYSSRTPVARNLIEAILASMGGSFHPGASGPVGPSSEGAEKFLELVLHMEIDGWLQGFIFEMASLGQIESFGHLREAVEEGLGLGRLSRRILHPPIDALIIKPFEQLINTAYRPTHLAVDVLIRQFLRGLIDRATLDTELGYKGYSADRIEALLNFNRVHLSIGNIGTLLQHGSITQEFATQLFAGQGYDADTMALELQVAEVKQKNSFTMDLARKAIEEYKHGRITIERLSHFITDPGLTQLQRNYLLILSDFEQSTPQTKLSLQQGVQMVEQGIWDITQFRDLAVSHRYALNDVDDLELLLLGKIVDRADAIKRKADQAKAKADADAARIQRAKDAAARALAEHEVHGVSIARYETLVLDGIKSVAEYQAFLLGKGISAGNTAAFVAQLNNRLAAAAAKPGAKAGPVAAAAAKGLSVSQLEKAVKLGHVSMAEFTARLTHAGLPLEDIAILEEILRDEIDAAQVKADAAAAAHAAAAHKGLNLGQEQVAARQGFITVEQYAAWLSTHGYIDPDLAILVAEMKARIAADAAARALKSAPAPNPAVKTLSLSQLERAVRAGLSQIGDYTAALAHAGYDADAQDSLTGLLQLQIAQDQRTAAARGQANGLLSPRGLTLADYERAVKAKVLRIGDYTDALGRAGVDPAAAQILSLVLASSIKNVTPKPDTIPTVSALLAAKGVSLSRLESDVLAGRLGLPAFTTILTGAGATADQVSQLEAVLQLELDQRKAAADLAAAAGKRAAAKQLSLAQEVAAIKANVQGLPDYQSLAEKLGYDPAAVHILVATLASDPKLFPPAEGV